MLLTPDSHGLGAPATSDPSRAPWGCAARSSTRSRYPAMLWEPLYGDEGWSRG